MLWFLLCWLLLRFQSTLPAREATVNVCAGTMPWQGFQSTLPAREATYLEQKDFTNTLNISIHASREGSDRSERAGARRQRFQSTLPAREATLPAGTTSPISIFQSTLPAREATVSGVWAVATAKNFNPRFPRGKRLFMMLARSSVEIISIHASREGSDHVKMSMKLSRRISIHASREGSDCALKLSPDYRT